MNYSVDYNEVYKLSSSHVMTTLTLSLISSTLALLLFDLHYHGGPTLSQLVPSGLESLAWVLSSICLNQGLIGHIFFDIALPLLDYFIGCGRSSSCDHLYRLSKVLFGPYPKPMIMVYQ